MLNPDHAFLADVLIAARKVKRFVSGVCRTEFEDDDMRESAVVRQLTIIGEAAKNVSPGFRAAHPEIPWRKMAGCGTFSSTRTAGWISRRYGSSPLNRFRP